MPICFLCRSVINSLKLLCVHFKMVHRLTENCIYKSCEQKCSRSYLSLNSFKKHFKSHDVLENVNINPNLPISHENKKTKLCVLDYDTSDLEKSNSQNILNMPPIMLDFNELIKNQVTILISKLYSKMTLPRSMVQNVINDFECCFLLPLEEIKSKINLASFNNSSEKECILEMSNSMQNMFSKLNSEYLRFQFLNESQKFVQTEDVIIGHDMNIGVSDVLQTKDITFQFIPLRKILKCFFEMQNVFQICKIYFDTLKNEHNVYSNIVQGLLWNSKTFDTSELVFPLLIYFDEFEVGNPLGSHSGIHKLGAVCICISTHNSSRVQFTIK